MYSLFDTRRCTDVADHGSYLVLHTVNGRLIAHVECSDFVHCLTFSPAAQGRAVNVVAGGMSSGKIRSVSRH